MAATAATTAGALAAGGTWCRGSKVKPTVVTRTHATATAPETFAVLHDIAASVDFAMAATGPATAPPLATASAFEIRESLLRISFAR